MKLPNNLIFKQISDALGGRKFLVMATGTYLMIANKLNSRWWFWLAIVYMFFNIVESFTPNLNASIPDIIKIVKAELHIPEDQQPQQIQQPKI